LLNAAGLRDGHGTLVGCVVILADLTARRAQEDAQLRQSRVLEAVASILRGAFRAHDEQELGEICLQVVQEVTQSRYGFLGELSERGFEEVAVSNPGWEPCTALGSLGHRGEGHRGHGIYSRVLSEAKAQVVNDVASQQSSFTLPCGHPPLESFLGVPLVRGSRVTGLVAVANREGGYTGAQQEALERLAPAIVEAFQCLRLHDHLKGVLTELENRVEQQIAELREKDQLLLLQSRQAAMGEMIGNIAHQWRHPLNLLGLTVQQFLLFYDLGHFDRGFVSQSVSKAMELIEHMSRTIDDFRNYFKPDKVKVDFSVKETIAGTLSLIRGSLQTPRIDVELHAHCDPVIHGYPNEFAQVLINLLINARDALAERQCPAPKVVITIAQEDQNAVITVADNAGGVPEEIIDKIFDPYFSTKGPQLGTGVGLFMSKSIIERNMGGSLQVRNTEEGAEFRIRL